MVAAFSAVGEPGRDASRTEFFGLKCLEPSIPATDSCGDFPPSVRHFTSLETRCLLRKLNSGESGHPCPVPDLRGNAFSFSLLRMMFAVGLSYMAFIMLR